MNQNKYVIVGAGPVGLWTAIQLKLRQPDCHVLVYEKNQEYSRGHVLRLDNWSMILYAKNIKIPENMKLSYQNFIKEVSQSNNIFPDFAKSLFIRTNELESALKKFAKNLGVLIDYRQIESLNQAEQLNPDTKIFIAVDGANSKLRKEMFPNKDIEEQTLQRILEVKMEVFSEEKISKFGKRDLAKFQKNTSYNSFEYIGKKTLKSTPISLRIFLNKKEFENFPDATFKKSLKIEDFQKQQDNILMKKIYQHIESYVEEKKLKEPSVQLLDFNVTKLKLNSFKAVSFVHQRNDVNWFLCGDSALGVPYFRALNSGMILSSRLCQILTGQFMANTMKEKVNLYKIQEKLHSQTEFQIASFKNNVLSIYNQFFQRLRKKQENINLIEDDVLKNIYINRQISLFGDKNENKIK